MGLFRKLFGPPSPERFAERVASVLRKSGAFEAIAYDHGEFCLRLRRPSRSAETMFLENFYAEHRKLPRNRRATHIRNLVQSCLASSSDLPLDLEEARPHFRAKVWDRYTFEEVALQGELEGKRTPDLPFEEIGSHLLAGPVYDLPDSVRTISYDDLEKWGISHYEAMESARHNLREMPFAFAGLEGSFYASVVEDSYDSSRVLLEDVIRKLEVAGDHIALVPSRDSLFITGSEDEKGLEMLTEHGEKALEEPRPMSGIPLRLSTTGWTEWMPPRDHRLYSRFRSLETKTLGPRYAQQQRLLAALLEKRGEELFVASYSVVQDRETGDLRSYCVWGDGLLALIPEAHSVVFMTRHGSGEEPTTVALAPWAKVVEVVGDLMEPTEHYPPRYRVSRFPGTEQLAALGRHEI